MPRQSFLPICLLFLSSGSIAVSPVAAARDMRELTDYSLEQLMEVSIEVTSAGRKSQKLEDAATAITVISAEDIRLSGMTSLPELLRMVPGLQVAEINGNTTAIGSRGFSHRFSNKLLVLLDGRTLYTPTFSGVFWDAQDVVLEDIERIEVIRGPGGTLWGANAVNGVINITTKSAAATQGGLVSAGVGNYERQGTVRYGGEIGENGHFRIYAKDAGYDSFPLASGSAAHDQLNQRSAGFRTDWVLPGGDTVMVQGGVYDGNADQTLAAARLSPPATLPLDFNIAQKSGNLSMSWKHALSTTSEWSLKFYYDYYERRSVASGERRDTYDVDFQHRTLLAENHDVVWGLGWRQTSDDMDAKFIFSFAPQASRDNVASAFIQDEIALVKDRLRLIVGTKFEHNEHTGLEHQPNLRLLWKIDERQTGWAALSRAVRTPARSDLGIIFNVAALPGVGGKPPSLGRITGNPEIQSEDLLAYEAGYRVRPTERLHLDVTAFYNDYRNIMTNEPGLPFPEAGAPTRIVVPYLFQNKASATSHGMELSASWQPAENWQFKAGYSWLEMRIRRDADSADTTIEARNGWEPQQQLQFQARHALDSKTDLSAALYYVDKLPSQNVAAYTRLDARWGWRPRRDLEISLAARNLLDRQHPEFVSTIVGPMTSEVPRSVFGAATWRF